MKQLIVNADDFGLTEGVNFGIIEAHFEGIVTSATLLANGPAFDSAVGISKSVRGLGVGVHLNLSEGLPVSHPARIATLLNARRELHLSPLRLWAGIAAGQIRLSEVETELRAQIMKVVVRAGIRPTHLDGHKHVHIVPGISDAVIRLALEFGIPGVRCPVEKTPAALGVIRNPQGWMMAKQYLVGRSVSCVARGFTNKLCRAGLVFPSHFHGLSQTGFLDVRALEEILDRLPTGSNELMCHPGYCEVELERTGTRLLEQRETEIAALKAATQIVSARRIRLVNYGEMVTRAQGSESAA